MLDLKLQFAGARTHLTKALELAPDEAKAQVMNALAVSYAFEGNAKEAASFYQKIFDKQMAESNLAPRPATANALGRVYLETGDVANARRWYQTGYESARRQRGRDHRAARASGSSAGCTRRRASLRAPGSSTMRTRR